MKKKYSPNIDVRLSVEAKLKQERLKNPQLFFYNERNQLSPKSMGNGGRGRKNAFQQEQFLSNYNSYIPNYDTKAEGMRCLNAAKRLKKYKNARLENFSVTRSQDGPDFNYGGSSQTSRHNSIPVNQYTSLSTAKSNTNLKSNRSKHS